MPLTAPASSAKALRSNSPLLWPRNMTNSRPPGSRVFASRETSCARAAKSAPLRRRAATASVLLARAEQDMARADSLLHGELFGMCLVVPALLLGIDLGDRLDLLAPR